jgi:pilus assembly protein CpaF
MVLMAGFELPVRAIRQQVSSALDMIVHLERLEDGGRRVINITEVQRMEADVVTMQDIFKYHVDEVTPDGVIVGGLRSTGLRLASITKFERRGVTLPIGLFREPPYSQVGVVGSPGVLAPGALGQ